MYSIQKPKLSVTISLLAGLILVGLYALYQAAHFAFGQVMANKSQAVAVALFIEAVMAVDALAIIRARRVWDNVPALIGMVIALLVSGTYNYIQAQTTGATVGLVNWWQLGTLALGPIAALVSASMALGREIRSYEVTVMVWETGRQAWQDERDAERRQAQEGARQAKIAADLEAERIKAEAARIQLGMQIQAQERQAARDARQVVKLAKIAAKGASQGVTGGAQGVTPKGQTVTGGDTRTTAELVLEYFSRHPDGTITDAATYAGRSRTAASKALHKLETEGKIHRNGRVMVLEQGE